LQKLASILAIDEKFVIVPVLALGDFEGLDLAFSERSLRSEMAVEICKFVFVIHGVFWLKCCPKRGGRASRMDLRSCTRFAGFLPGMADESFPAKSGFEKKCSCQRELLSPIHAGASDFFGFLPLVKAFDFSPV